LISGLDGRQQTVTDSRVIRRHLPLYIVTDTLNKLRSMGRAYALFRKNHQLSAPVAFGIPFNNVAQRHLYVVQPVNIVSSKQHTGLNGIWQAIYRQLHFIYNPHTLEITLSPIPFLRVFASD